MEKYSAFIASIKELIEAKMELLDAEASSESIKPRRTTIHKLIIQLCDLGEFVYTETKDKKAEYIFINGLLADILESVHQNLLDEKKGRENETAEGFDRIRFSLMARYRKLLAALSSADAELNTPSQNDKYLPDDRLELILTALRRTTEFDHLLIKEYKHSPLFFYSGYALLILTGIAWIARLAFLVIDSLNDILSTVSNAVLVNTSFEEASKIISITFTVMLIIYFIATKIYLKLLKAKANEGNASARYALAFYYLTPLGFSILINEKKYIYEIMESADSGYPPAMFHLGRLYESGYRGIIKKDGRLAKQYYARSARYIKEAKQRYDALSHNMS